LGARQEVGEKLQSSGANDPAETHFLAIRSATFALMPWVVLFVVAALSVFLHRENKAQNSVIFRDSW
jgi:hypothetical protein